MRRDLVLHTIFLLKRLKLCRIGEKAKLLCQRLRTEGATRRIKMVYCEGRSKMWLLCHDGIGPHTTKCNPNFPISGSVSGPFLPMILTSQEKWGWKGLQFSSLSSCWKQSQLEGQARLFRALSSKVLKISKNVDCTIYLGNLLHCLTALTVKKLLHIPGLKLCCSILRLLFLILLPCTIVKSLAPSPW